MRRIQILSASLLLTLAGCSSTPKFTMWDGGGMDSAPPQKPTQPSTQTNRVVVPPTPPPKAVTNASTIPAISTAPVVSSPSSDTWIALGIWCRTTGLAKLTQLPGEKPISYQLENAAGKIEFTIGSQVARWNGMNFMLSFAPRLTEHHPCVHHLDLEKSLLPILNQCAGAAFTNKTIVLDPGHGGEQTGTRSVIGNHFEKEYTLDWALRLQKILVNKGWKVILTRSNDFDVALSNRVALAERSAADVFISLHFNSAGSEQSGLETYCVTPLGLPSNLTRDYPDDPARIVPNNAFDLSNFCLALKLHRSILKETKESDRSVRRARFMTVLRGQNRPAVLIEGGYLSNRKEAGLIATGEYRQKLAQAVADALP